MSKDTIYQWDTDPDNNTDVGGVGTSGSSNLSAGDNAMRAIMAQIAAANGKGSDVASASTITLAAQHYYHVTGTTTITDIDFTDAVNGRWAILVFDGALTFTHNATTLILPGGANITTAANDCCIVVQDSSDNVIVPFYQRASGGVMGLASAANFRANTSNSLALGAPGVWSAAAEVTLTDDTTIAVDMSTFINAKVTLTDNRTLGQPSNAKVGQSGVISIIQDGTGSRTLDYHADWEFAGATAPTLSTTAGAKDLLFYQVLASGSIFASLVKAVG